MLVQLTGNVTKDAIIKNTGKEKQVVSFSIALNHTYKGKAGKVRKCTYVECSYWLSTAVATFLTKGKPVQVSGFISPNAYTNKEGVAVGTIQCNVNTLEFLSKGSAGAASTPAESGQPGGENTDDLPF